MEASAVSSQTRTLSARIGEIEHRCWVRSVASDRRDGCRAAGRHVGRMLQDGKWRETDVWRLVCCLNLQLQYGVILYLFILYIYLWWTTTYCIYHFLFCVPIGCNCFPFTTVKKHNWITTPSWLFLSFTRQNYCQRPPVTYRTHVSVSSGRGTAGSGRKQEHARNLAPQGGAPGPSWWQKVRGL